MNNTTNLKQVKEYYETRYRDKSRFVRKAEDYKIYLDYLGIDKNSTGGLLDVGCGSGLLLRNVETTKLKTFGTDISMTALKLSQRATSRTHYVINSGEAICFKSRQFDYVFCLGSLEHFLDIPVAISEMKRVSKPNAKFCILVPNTVHYRLDADSKWGIKRITGTKQQEMQEELHTFSEWRHILETNGLKVVKYYKDRFFVKKKNILKNLLFSLWLKFLPLKYSYQFIFVCGNR